MQILKTKILLKCSLLSIGLVLLWLLYNRYSTYSFVLKDQYYSCSFNHIDVCQMQKNINRTFLYITWNKAGFCSEFNQILLAFAYSVSTKRHFLIDSRQWNYGNFTDYFNLPSINYYSQTNRRFLVENNTQNNQINHLKTTRIGTQVRKFWIATKPVQTIQLKRRVAHYLWKSLSEETFKFVQTCRIRNLSNYIGIHIRKGDKIIEESIGIPLEKYIKSIEKLFNQNKTFQHIFVTSDDHTVIKELRQLKPIWNFINIDYNNRWTTNTTGHFQLDFNRLSKEDKLYEARLLMCELQMLVDSDYVVCAMSSNVCRLVQILRHQHPSTIISLDQSWRAT